MVLCSSREIVSLQIFNDKLAGPLAYCSGSNGPSPRPPVQMAEQLFQLAPQKRYIYANFS
jgi:hypothetical protein